MKNSILQPRTKLVNFRVTEDEYEKLRSASVARGARCLSDFARVAVMQAAGGAATSADPDFHRRIAAIESEVARLANRFDIQTQE
jgi:hypothetical protein